MHGGKSYFLRWAALGLTMYYSALAKQSVPVGLFSEDYPTLEDRQLSKLTREFPPELGALKHSQVDGLVFQLNDGGPGLPGGRILLRNLDDPSKYMSTEFAAILVEELTKNDFNTFLNLRTRLRYPNITDVKFVGATNPGGVGHVWCKKHWIDKNSGDPEQALFHYIPATLDDNKYTTESYRQQIDALPERLRRAYRDGDWQAFEGQFFSTFDPTRLIDPIFIPESWDLVGSLDPGWASPLSFGLQARDHTGIEYRIATYYYGERGPEEHADQIKAFIGENLYTGGRMPNMIVAGHDAFAKKDTHAIKASDKTMADVFSERGLFLHKAAVDRHNGWGSWRAMMPERYKIFKGTNGPLVNQLIQTLADENDPEDIEGRGHDPSVEDHALDDGRYGHMALYKYAAPEMEEPPPSDWKEMMNRQADKFVSNTRRRRNLA